MRFQKQLVIDKLRTRLNATKDAHQHRGEFVEGCLQCEKCKLIRQIATELGIIFEVDPSLKVDMRRFGNRAFTRGMRGERLLMSDTDMRVRGRTRAGK